MADIFISYSQKDRHIAEELSKFLDQCGYSVWWDYELVGGSKFRKEIEAQLQAAKAAIIIWTENSVESGFVLDEAQVAQSLGKILPTRVPEFDHKYIPLGFKQLQTDLVTKPDLILRSLEEKFGVGPSKPPVARPSEPVAIGGGTIDEAAVTAADQFANWEFIKTSTAPQDFHDYIARFPASPLAELARARLVKLEDEAWATVSHGRDVGALRRFLELYPKGRHEGVVRRLLQGLEREAWSAVNKEDPAALRAFLAQFPDGLLTDDIRFRLSEIDKRAEEASAWAAFERAPTRAALEAYVSQFPFGAHVDEAKGRLAVLINEERRAAAWAKIKDAGYSEQLRAFIAEFDSGPEVEEARAKLAVRLREKEDGAWSAVKATSHPADMLRFLREFPSGAHREEAIALLREMPARIETEAWEAVAGTDDPLLYSAFLLACPAGAHAGEARRRGGKMPTAPAVPKAPDGITVGLVSEPRPSRLATLGRGLFLALALGGYFGSLAYLNVLLSSGLSFESSALVAAIGMLSAFLVGRAFWAWLVRSNRVSFASNAFRATVKYVVWCAPAPVWLGLLQTVYTPIYYTYFILPIEGFAIFGVAFAAVLAVLLFGRLAERLGRTWIIYVLPVLICAISGIAAVAGLSTAGQLYFVSDGFLTNDSALYMFFVVILSTVTWLWSRWRGHDAADMPQPDAGSSVASEPAMG